MDWISVDCSVREFEGRSVSLSSVSSVRRFVWLGRTDGIDIECGMPLPGCRALGFVTPWKLVAPLSAV